MKAPCPGTGERVRGRRRRCGLISTAPPRRRARISSWARLASAPIWVASSRGSPIRTLARRADSASCTASRCSAGAMARRMAVHFCPALAVISRATSLMNRSNSGVPGAASGPRIEALRLSRSATKRTDSRPITGCDCSFIAVAAEPVKLTTSWQVSVLQQIAGRARRAAGSRRRGRMSASIMIRNAGLGQIQAVWLRRLHDRRHAREEGRRRASPAFPRSGS